MLLSAVGSAMIVVGLVLSNRAYDHTQRWYATGRVPSAHNQPFFRVVYAVVRIVVPAVSIASLWSNSPWLLRMYDDGMALGVGVVVSMIGLWLFWLAKRTLGARYSPCFDAYLPITIASEGPYRLVRHPIYSANLLALGSLALGTGSLWLMLVFVLVLIAYDKAARLEDDELSRNFPGREAAKYRFIPLVY